jgi:hypothetical protein
MPPFDYVTKIQGFRLLRKRGLPSVATTWDFQTTPEFSAESAHRLFAELPDNCYISFLDAWKREESCFFVRRDGERFLVKRGRGMPRWSVETINRILEWFMASPFVSKPLDSFESFTLSSIPEHLRDQHLNESLA